ncbi:hypothetical protein GZL_05727 [Streptomyces sp. 769]|nr:hypothetical protein GZL_05727 [Streptomyces sp. 769]
MGLQSTTVERRVQAGFLHQGRHVAEPGVRPVRPARPVPQNADDLPQLRHGVGAVAAYGLGIPPDGVVGGGRPQGAGLRGDDAQVVRNAVVHLAGHTGALLRHGPLGFQAAAVRLGGDQVREPGLQLGAGAKEQPEPGGADAEHESHLDHEQMVAPVHRPAVEVVPGPHGRREQCGRRDADDGTAGGPGRHREHGDHGSQPQVAGGHGRQGGEQHGHREAAAQHQREQRRRAHERREGVERIVESQQLRGGRRDDHPVDNERGPTGTPIPPHPLTTKTKAGSASEPVSAPEPRSSPEEGSATQERPAPASAHSCSPFSRAKGIRIHGFSVAMPLPMPMPAAD